MKSHLIKASIVCAGILGLNLALAQSPTPPTASSAMPQAIGPNSAFTNAVAQSGSAKVNGAGMPAAQGDASAAVPSAAAKVMVSPPAAQAATLPISSNTTAVGTTSAKAKELEALQAEIPLWKAKAEIAKYRAEVSKAEQSMGGTLGAPLPIPGAGQLPQGPMPNAMPVRIPTSVDRGEADGMRLVTLRAFDGRFDAVVDIGGNVVTVRAGDTVGQWKVTTIGSAGVQLTSGKRVRTLRL